MDVSLNVIKKKVSFVYLKKGEGNLSSNNYKVTKFAQKRREKVIKEQEERERKRKE